MQRSEFNAETDRLSRGFKQKLTDERRDALWSAVEHWPAGLFTMATTRLLGGKYFPDIEAIERAADSVRARFSVRNPEPRVAPEADVDAGQYSEYGRARMDLVIYQSNHNCTPRQVAELLGPLIEKFPQHRENLQLECAALDKCDTWHEYDVPFKREMDLRGAAQSGRVMTERDDELVVEVSMESPGGGEPRPVVRVDPKRYYRSERAKQIYIDSGSGLVPRGTETQEGEA